MLILGMPIGEVMRVVILPILFIFFNGLVEIGIATSRGLVKEGRSIRVLYRDHRRRVQELHTEPSELLTFREVHRNVSQIISVESLSTVNLLDYPSIPVNLCFAALSADSLAFFSSGISDVIHVYKWLFPVHIFSLIVIVVISYVGLKIESLPTRRLVGGILLFLGFISAFAGFIALRSLL